jgi:hypothetical protein
MVKPWVVAKEMKIQILFETCCVYDIIMMTPKNINK